MVSVTIAVGDPNFIVSLANLFLCTLPLPPSKDLKNQNKQTKPKKNPPKQSNKTSTHTNQPQKSPYLLFSWKNVVKQTQIRTQSSQRKLRGTSSKYHVEEHNEKVFFPCYKVLQLT